MKFQDLFVPRWRHSDPEVRKGTVEKMTDAGLLAQIAEKDEHPMVREAAASRVEMLKAE